MPSDLIMPEGNKQRQSDANLHVRKDSADESLKGNISIDQLKELMKNPQIAKFLEE